MDLFLRNMNHITVLKARSASAIRLFLRLGLLDNEYTGKPGDGNARKMTKTGKGDMGALVSKTGSPSVYSSLMKVAPLTPRRRPTGFPSYFHPPLPIRTIHSTCQEQPHLQEHPSSRRL